MEKSLLLEVYSVNCNVEAVACDYVRLPVAEESGGKFSGSCGIKKGHAKSAVSLGEGFVSADLNGETVFKAEIRGGFAVIENNIVSLTVGEIRM